MLFDTLKKTLYAGVGMAFLTRDKIEEMAKKLAEEAKLSEADGKKFIDELLKTAQGMDFVLLLKERDGGIHGSFRSVVPSVDVSKLAAIFGGGGHTQAAGLLTSAGWRVLAAPARADLRTLWREAAAANRAGGTLTGAGR